MNKLDLLLTSIKEENIDIVSLDFKTKRLIQATPHHYTVPKFSMITALSLFAMVSILGSYNIYNTHQQQLALEKIQQERANFSNSEYMYATIVSSYERGK